MAPSFGALERSAGGEKVPPALPTSHPCLGLLLLLLLLLLLVMLSLLLRLPVLLLPARWPCRVLPAGIGRLQWRRPGAGSAGSSSEVIKAMGLALYRIDRNRG
jgi:hypothetical protein